MAVSQLIGSEISTANPVPEMGFVKHVENAWLRAISIKPPYYIIKRRTTIYIYNYIVYDMYIQMIVQCPTYIKQPGMFMGSVVAVNRVIWPKGATFALPTFVMN